METGEFTVYTLYVSCHGKSPQRLSLPADALLPGMQQLHLTARLFFRHADTEVGWTDLRALTALEQLYRMSHIPFAVDRAFCARQPLSPYGSGIGFDLGKALSPLERTMLRCCAVKSGLFVSVAPEALFPDRVHVVCLRCRALRPGDCGVFVCSLQRALQQIWLFSDVCSGEFCRETERAVIRMQRRLGQDPTGIADARLIRALREETERERGCHPCSTE